MLVLGSATVAVKAHGAPLGGLLEPHLLTPKFLSIASATSWAGRRVVNGPPTDMRVVASTSMYCGRGAQLGSDHQRSRPHVAWPS